MSPRVSIGLPVYNGERWLPAAVDSLLAQDFTDLELVISDNASEDRTQAICMEYAALDPRVKYSRNAENRGAHYNFVRVQELATGELFMWASHDDLWSRDYVGKLVAGFAEGDGVLLVAGRTIFVNEDGSLAAETPDDAPPRTVQPRAIVVERLLAQHATSWFFGLYRRDAMGELMAMLPHVPLWGGDVVILLHCVLRHNVVGDDGATIYKRLRLTSSHQPETPRAWTAWQATFATRLLREVIAAPLPPRERLAIAGHVLRYLRPMIFRKGLKRTVDVWLRAAYQLSRGRDRA